MRILATAIVIAIVAASAGCLGQFVIIFTRVRADSDRGLRRRLKRLRGRLQQLRQHPPR